MPKNNSYYLAFGFIITSTNCFGLYQNINTFSCRVNIFTMSHMGLMGIWDGEGLNRGTVVFSLG
jgi:hypothetical protein